MNADSSTTEFATITEEVVDFVQAVAKTKEAKPSTKRMKNPTPDHTGDQYKGPKNAKNIHNISGRTYEFDRPVTRSEAVKLLASPDDTFKDVGAFMPVLAKRQPGSKKKWLKLKSKYSPRH